MFRADIKNRFSKRWVPLLSAVLLGIIFLSLGCRTGSKNKLNRRTDETSTNTILTPNLKPVGRVVHINKLGRFVVINYAIGPFPQRGQKIFAYRNGLRVAELRITGPEEDTNTVADVLTGDPQLQDEVLED